MLNTFHLRTFLVVVEAGNYTAAAEQLHMSQPAVSQHIRALEEQLGNVRLFRRVGQRMMPTHAGEELLGMARDLVLLAERAEQKILALRGHVAGRVAIGCTPNSGERLLPPLLAAFHASFPAIMLEVEVAPTDMLLDALSNRQLSVILVEEQHRRRGWVSHVLGHEHLALVAPPGHALLTGQSLSLSALKDCALVLPSNGSPLRRVIDERLRRRGISLSATQVVLETDSIAMMAQCIRAGLGVGFIPDSCLACIEDLDRIQLSDGPLHQEWRLLHIGEREASRAASELFKFLSSPQALELLTSLGIQSPAETSE